MGADNHITVDVTMDSQEGEAAELYQLYNSEGEPAGLYVKGNNLAQAYSELDRASDIIDDGEYGFLKPE